MSRVALRVPPELVDRGGPAGQPGDEPGLRALIVDEIRSRGPMTFERFMALALYEPGLGYYASGDRGPGRAGDFLTAPEAHPIFGWLVARQLEEVWDRLGRPERFTIREHGAATGALAAAIVGGLERRGSALRSHLRYRIVEASAARFDQVAGRLRTMNPPADDLLEPDDGAPVVGAILANEVLDALPVHRVVGRRDGRIEELFVDLDRSRRRVAGDRPALVERAGPPSTPALAARLLAESVRLAPGQRAEVCLAVDGWMAATAAGLERGLVMLVDYGHPAPELYRPDRGSRLRAYVRHTVHDDPFRNVGRQDLTAHVDLTAVERAAVALGLDHLGTTRQAAFLAALGAGSVLVGLQTEPGATLQGYLDARSALVRMLDPAASGAFAVMLFGRGLDPGPPLTGLGPPVARG